VNQLKHFSQCNNIQYIVNKYNKLTFYSDIKICLMIVYKKKNYDDYDCSLLANYALANHNVLYGAHSFYAGKNLITSIGNLEI